MKFPPPDRYNPATVHRFRDYRDPYYGHIETRAIDDSNAYARENVNIRHMREFRQMPVMFRCEGSLGLYDCYHKIEMPLALIGNKYLSIMTPIANAPLLIRGFRIIETKAYSLYDWGRNIEFMQPIPETHKQNFIGRPISELIDCPILKATDHADNIIKGWDGETGSRPTAFLDNDAKMDRIKETLGAYDGKDHYDFHRLCHDIYYDARPLPIRCADRDEAVSHKAYRISKDEELWRRRIEKAFRAIERSYEKNPPRSHYENYYRLDK